MNSAEYPNLKPVTGMDRSLTHSQRFIHTIESTIPMHLTYALWFTGTTGSFVANNLPMEHRAPAYFFVAAFFIASIISFAIFWRNGHVSTMNMYSEQRISLMQMGVKRPMRFIKEHPLHLAAYKELKGDLNSVEEVNYLDSMFNRHHAIAMLVYTKAERYNSGPAILGIVKDRGITQPLGIAALLDEFDQHHSALSEGAL